MTKQLIRTIALLAIIFATSSINATSAQSTNLRAGDWIEYQVTAVGNFPGEHNVNWTRIEIMDVSSELVLNITAQLETGFYVYYNYTVDFEKGKLLEGFFLPPNVTVGDTFFDSLVGNITISVIEHRTYCGAKRTIVVGVTPETTYYWDEAKRIMVEANSAYPNFNYTVNTIAEKTNIWQPQIFGLGKEVFYAITVGIAITAIVLLFIFYRFKKKP